MRDRNIDRGGSTALDIVAMSIVVLVVIVCLALMQWRKSQIRAVTAPALVGDCNGDGFVRPHEWALCWAIEAGSAGRNGLSLCPACDADSDGVVTREEAGWATGNDSGQVWDRK